MLLNIEKCKTITFSRRTDWNLLSTEYAIDGRVLKRVDVVNGLGILIDCKMMLKAQVNHVVSRRKFMLGFVKRLTKDFDCPHVARSLYCSPIRPLMRCMRQLCEIHYSNVTILELSLFRSNLFCSRYDTFSG